MGTKVTIPPLGIPSNSSFITELNNDLDQLGDEFDNVIYRDGSQSWLGNMNANSKRLYNLPIPVNSTEPVRLDGVLDLVDDLTGGFGTGMKAYSTRPELASSLALPGNLSFLTEVDRKGIFKLDASNLSVKVTNDPAQAVYIPVSGDPTGTSGAWVRQMDGQISVKYFGALGNNIADDTAAIQAGLNYLNYIGGGTLYFPEGTYKVTSYLSVYPKTIVKGASRVASVIQTAMAGGGGANAHENLRNGSVFVSLSPINSSTAVHVNVEDIGIKNINAAAVGAGIYERGGTFLHFHHVRVEGFKFGMVLDQTELAEIELCDFEAQNAGGAGVWLVNVADLNAGALGIFTNRISISRCQFNEGTTTYGILDDGGVVHTFSDNNYNGCLNHIRLAGVDGGLNIRGGEFESSTGHCIEMFAASLAGSGVGACTGNITGGAFATTGAPANGGAGWAAINIHSAGVLEIGGGITFATPTGASVRGAVNCPLLIPTAIRTTFAADTVFDSYATIQGANTTMQAVAPASGAHRVGEVVFNNNPTTGSVLGWRCTTAGSPGTWETLYVWTGHIAVGSSVIFDDSVDATYQSSIDHNLASPYRYLRSIALAGGGTWQGGFQWQANYNGGAVYDLAFLRANTDGTTAAFSVVGTISSSGTLSGSNINTSGFMTNLTGLSVVGRSTNSSGVAAAVTGTTDQVLRVDSAGTGLGFGTIATGGITAAAVTYAKIQNVAANRLLGNPTGSATAPSEISLAGGLAFSGTTLTAAGALTPTGVASTGAVTSSSATAGIGYATGAGGTVTQITSRTTTVTINKPCGAITLVSAAGSATFQSFSVSNTTVAATDTIIVNQKSGTDKYQIFVTNVAAGGFQITFATTGGTTTETPVFNFSVIKAVTA